VIACAVAAAIIGYRHRDNVERLLAGTERRLGQRRPSS
jgi:glycerol-3-phosphate acyltransferase PlsY